LNIYQIKCCPECNLPYEKQYFGPYDGPTCECWFEEAIKNNPVEIDDFEYFDDPENFYHDTNLNYEHGITGFDYSGQNAEYLKQLKQKYGIPWLNDANLEPVISEILVKLEQNKQMTPDGINWLISNRVNILAGYIFHLRYNESNDPYDLAIAGSQYRKSGNPQKTIEITQAHCNMPYPSSAVLTTRGAAFRNLKQIENAFNCADAAIRISPTSPHPYNLKGGLFFDIHEYEKGYQCFSKARELSEPYSPDCQHFEIKKILQSDSSHKHQIAHFFYNKDSQKFKWIQTYLVY
jgi:tetratricopeptide (TPR) repeat protein